MRGSVLPFGGVGPQTPDAVRPLCVDRNLDPRVVGGRLHGGGVSAEHPTCDAVGELGPVPVQAESDRSRPASSRSARMASAWSAGVDTGPAFRADSQHGHRHPAFAPIALP